MSDDAPAVSYSLAAGLIVGGRGEYLGYTVQEDAESPAAASVVLYDNATEGSGAILETITLNGGESASDNYTRPGRLVKNGIFAVITGVVLGSAFA